MPEWLKRLIEKVDDPKSMLERSYRTLIDETLKLRQDYTVSVARETSIERKLTNMRNSQEEKTSLEAELIKQRSISQDLNISLQNKESEVQKSYTKMQVMIARRKADDASSKVDPQRATLVIIAIMIAWALIGVFLNLKSYLK